MADLLDPLFYTEILSPEAICGSVSFFPQENNSCQGCPGQRAVPLLSSTYLSPAAHSHSCWCWRGPVPLGLEALQQQPLPALSPQAGGC